MKVNIRQIYGNWDKGYVLDKHVLSSTFLGHDPSTGRAQFDTQRSEVGEELFQLKYRHDKTKVGTLAKQVVDSLLPLYGEEVSVIVPMPASNVRSWQPVTELANEIGKLTQALTLDNLIVKAPASAGVGQLKDMSTKAEKEAALANRFTINGRITNEGRWNFLLVDDLFDTGASMEAAAAALRTYTKVKNIYVAALTWK